MSIRGNLWVYKYRPQAFNDIILNEDIKPKLAKALEEIPNLLLYGTPGIGKGCFADLMINKDNIDYMWVNASDENGIEVFRNKIRPFATAMCMKEMKVVVLNECDSLTAGPQGAQKLLRQLMEDTYKICRFILICNYESYIIPEIKSRCQVIQFDNPPKKDIGKACLKILKKEDIEYKAKDVIDIVQKCYPDVRKTINVLQENTIDGVLTGSRIHASEELFKKIFDLALQRDLESVREELKSNYVPYPELYEYFYNNAGDLKNPVEGLLSIGEHLYRDINFPIKEINFMRMLVEFIAKGVV